MTGVSRFVVLTDFGSTYTKVAVADMREKQLVMAEHFPSTVAYDARVGLQQCFDAAEGAIGRDDFGKALKLSSSSAAGGLRMGVVGLSRTLSAAAGRNAAFGAGAKILKTCAGRLSREDVDALCALPLEILLFCGGYENGNVSALLHNAEMLAESSLHIPIIFAGNSAVDKDIRLLLSLHKKDFYVVRNIIPHVGMIDKLQVEEIIRDVFLKRIINMKGLDKVSSMLDRMVMPTPAAVLSAGELLSRGTEKQKGLGELMIVDIGGATTDIHSYADTTPYDSAKIVGAAEPYVKRTVEGDLGMRESSGSLTAEIGIDRMCRDTGLDQQQIESVICKWTDRNRELAESDSETKVDRTLARGAVHVSARRHAGWIEHISSAGIKTLQHGKNLSNIKAVIGTGGPIVFGGDAREKLSEALRDKDKEPDALLPEKARFYIDKDYIFFAAGLLREVDEEAAFKLMVNSLKEV
ncbi:MAG: MutL protein [Clostridia bacterium]|nr:MutL protein [Clostridia bacterium]